MATSSRKTSKTSKVAPEFTRTRDFISRYSVLDADELDVVTVWAMGTHCFSPACQWPATYPYLYVTGAAGSGKTVLGADSLGCVARSHTNATGATGSTLFRMLGIYDDETGEIDNLAPTLFLDEIDTTYSGAKDPDLTRSLDVGYKRGATIPRAAGKSFIAFPVYGPKLMMGIDNGHLPEPLLQRCLRIEMRKQTQDQLDAAGVQPFYIFDVEDEAAEMQEELAAWAKRNSMVLREYRPVAPKGLTARQWEISRSLVQLAHAIGNESRIVEALVNLFNRAPKAVDSRKEMLQAISDLYDAQPANHADRLTSRQIVECLNAQGVKIPGNSMKGLSSLLANIGVEPAFIRMRPGHPGINDEGKLTARGYYRHSFDESFIKYLDDDESEDC